VTDKLALGQVYLRALGLYLFVFIIIPMLQSLLLLLLLLPEGQTGEAWEPLKFNALSKIGVIE